jgi:TonB family protein
MRVLVLVVTALSIWSDTAVAEQSGDQSRATPGTVALMVEPKTSADVLLLGTVIGDPDPAVRAVAARVAGLLSRKSLAAPLQDLLEREQDVTAAVEQVRALLYLRGVEILPQARAAATRLGTPVRSTIDEWLARNQPEQFAASIPDLLRDYPDADSRIFASLAALAVRQTPAVRDRVTRSFTEVASGPDWREFLVGLGTDIDPPVISKGLTATLPAVREATIWFVVTYGTQIRTMPSPDVKSAIDSIAVPATSDDTEWAAFGRELLGRRSGKSHIADGSATIARHALTHSDDARTLATAPELTTAEHSALRSVIPKLAPWVPVKNKTPTVKPVDEMAKDKPRIRTFPSIAPGAFSSLLATVGCTLPSDSGAFGAAQVWFKADGRPIRIAMDSTTLTANCAPVIDYLARLTVAPPDLPVRADVPQWLFISMDRDVVRCMDERSQASSSAERTQRVGGKIKVPRKTKDVRPVYPQLMQRARIAGVVIIQATITATGCIASAEVLRSIVLPIDIEALKAVSGWRFTPTELDGIPVPVVMTVTVNFTLQ